PEESAQTPATDGSAAAQAPANEPTPEQIAALPKGREFGQQNKESRVELRMHKAARVLVQGPDNTVFLNRTLSPGDLFHAPNVVGLLLTTPDSGAVEILLDGTSMGFIGKSGVIAEGLSLNPQAIVDRHGHPQNG